jgi:hypothetical protein
MSSTPGRVSLPFLIQNPSVAVAILHGVVEGPRAVQERIDGSQL